MARQNDPGFGTVNAHGPKTEPETQEKLGPKTINCTDSTRTSSGSPPSISPRPPAWTHVRGFAERYARRWEPKRLRAFPSSAAR